MIKLPDWFDEESAAEGVRGKIGTNTMTPGSVVKMFFSSVALSETMSIAKSASGDFLVLWLPDNELRFFDENEKMQTLINVLVLRGNIPLGIFEDTQLPDLFYETIHTKWILP